MCSVSVRLLGLCALVFLCGTLLGAEGSGSGQGVDVVENPSSGDESEYVLKNRFLRVTVQAGRGGRAVVSEPEGELDRPGETVLEDSLDGRICRYSPDYATGSSSLGVVSLRFQGGGVRIRKTYSLLQNESALRAHYRIENRSQRSKRLDTRSIFPGLTGESIMAAGLGDTGLDRWKGPELRGGRRAAWDNPRWVSLMEQKQGRGYVLAPGPGVWQEAQVSGRGEEEGLTATSRSVEIPPDSRLDVDLRLIRVRGLSSVSGVQHGLVAGMSSDTAGRTARLDIHLYPFRPVDMTGVELGIHDASGDSLSTLRRDGLGLSPGRVTELSFYWRAPRAGWYELGLNPLNGGSPDPLLGSRLQVPGGTLEVNVPELASPSIARVRGRRDDLEDVPGPAESGANFHYRSGEPLFSLDLHLARQEKETAVFGVQFPEVEGRLSFDLESSLTGEEGAEIPESNYELVEVSGPGESDAEGTSSTLALRVSAGDCEPGLYEGSAVFQCGRQKALLPVSVRIWPIDRPRPGPVRLHAYPVRLTPGKDGPSATRWKGAWRQNNVAVSCPGKGLWAEQWMELLQVGPLGGEEGGTELPPLDFSRVGDQLEPLVLLGVGEFAAVLDVARPEPGVRIRGWGSFPADKLRKVEWFWSQFSSHLQGKAMRDLYVTSPWPLAASDITSRWLEKAFAVADAGWSVCGPYRESAISKLTLPRLANLTDLALVPRGDLAAYPDLARRLTDAGSGRMEAGMFLSPRSGTEVGSLLEGLRAAWTPSVSVVAIGPLAPESGSAAGQSRALVPGSVRWEEMLDVLDILNYAALLHRLRRAQDGQDVESIPAPTRDNKAAILRELSEARGRDGYPTGVTRWKGVVLARGGSSRARLVAASNTAQTTAPAQALANILSSSVNADFAPVGPGDIEHEASSAPLIVLATPPFGSFFSDLLPEEQFDPTQIAARLRGEGSYMVRFEAGGRQVIALLGSDAGQLGKAVLSFTGGIEQEWAVPSSSAR